MHWDVIGHNRGCKGRWSKWINVVERVHTISTTRKQMTGYVADWTDFNDSCMDWEGKEDVD